MVIILESRYWEQSNKIANKVTFSWVPSSSCFYTRESKFQDLWSCHLYTVQYYCALIREVQAFPQSPKHDWEHGWLKSTAVELSGGPCPHVHLCDRDADNCWPQQSGELSFPAQWPLVTYGHIHLNELQTCQSFIALVTFQARVHLCHGVQRGQHTLRASPSGQTALLVSTSAKVFRWHQGLRFQLSPVFSVSPILPMVKIK